MTHIPISIWMSIPNWDGRFAILSFFRVDVNEAPYENLILRVPGIGVKSAKLIVKLTQIWQIVVFSTQKMGVVMKRAQYFIVSRIVHANGQRINASVCSFRCHLKTNKSSGRSFCSTPSIGENNLSAASAFIHSDKQ